jgi:uncharacterized protein YraI
MSRHHILITRSLFALIILALAAFSMGSVYKVSAQAYPTATVATGALNVRSGPGISYSVVTSLYRGAALNLLSRTVDSSWIKVMLGNGAQGWVNARYIATAYPIYNLPTDNTAPSGPTAVVVTGALNVRSGPGLAFGTLLTLPRGTVVNLLSRTADSTWIKVSVSGVQGWLNGRYISTTYPVSSLPVEGSTQPVPTPVPSTRVHVVQPGENLFRIALNYGVNMYTLAAVNGITNFALIYVGQVLIIP